MERTHYVYFINAGSITKPPVKIGVTTDVDARITSLQTGNPHKLTCKALIECESRAEAYKLESYLHYKLRRFNLIGEWFKSEYFNLKDVLSEYFKFKSPTRSNDNYKGRELALSTFKSMHQELKELRNKNEELEAENDHLRDELENVLYQL